VLITIVIAIKYWKTTNTMPKFHPGGKCLRTKYSQNPFTEEQHDREEESHLPVAHSRRKSRPNAVAIPRKTAADRN
jgi:hypothetical protein